MRRLPTGDTTLIPKGVYRFKTHEEANQQQENCLAPRNGENCVGAGKWTQYRTKTNEYCRPASLDDLKTLIGSLNRQHVDYLLIGGYALFVHGYHRATTDIDVLVPATAESGARVKAALMVLPDQAAKDLEPEWFAEGDNIRVADAFVVDVMLNACGETYDHA